MTNFNFLFFWNFWKHRWGDGALRYQQVHLFPQLYEHTYYLCDVHYVHRFRHVATCAFPPTGRDEELDADEDEERRVHSKWPPRPGALQPRLREYSTLCAEATDLPHCMHTIPHEFERLSLHGQFVWIIYRVIVCRRQSRFDFLSFPQECIYSLISLLYWTIIFHYSLQFLFNFAHRIMRLCETFLAHIINHFLFWN